MTSQAGHAARTGAASFAAVLWDSASPSASPTDMLAGLHVSAAQEMTVLWVFFLETVSLLLPRLECNGAISAHRYVRLLGSGNSPASAS